MRKARIIEENGACYHVMSRVIERRMILDDGEKQRLMDLLYGMAAFSGVEILTFAALDNHFHTLLYVPARKDVDDAEFIERMGHLYDNTKVRTHTRELERLREEGDAARAEAYKARFTYRMYDLSQFMKTVKQRFTQSYNRRHGRKGTLWEERFKSVLVQPPTGKRLSTAGQLTAAAAIGLYIDLNTVRAGIVGDPKDFRFCGYGQAVGGNRAARDGICHIAGSLDGATNWKNAAAIYRQLLYMRGESVNVPGQPTQPGFSPEAVREVLDADGKLDIHDVLRCRVRYLTDGVILGSHEYVQQVCSRHRDFFGAKRKTGPRPMTGSDWGNLYTARRLRRDVIALPDMSTDRDALAGSA